MVTHAICTREEFTCGYTRRMKQSRKEFLAQSDEQVQRHIIERRAITQSHKDVDDTASTGQAAADAVARFGGSWTFIGLFGVVLVSWVVLNSWLLVRAGATPFDPFPYILLNLFLSMLASIQAPVILMSQNRQAEKDRDNARNDYEVNLKAELEIMALHEKVDAIKAIQLEQTQLLARLLVHKEGVSQ
jgi:uncharacterized membrane protein